MMFIASAATMMKNKAPTWALMAESSCLFRNGGKEGFFPPPFPPPVLVKLVLLVELFFVTVTLAPMVDNAVAVGSEINQGSFSSLDLGDMNSR